MAVTRARNRNDRPPLDAGTLEQAALSYAGRYATTRAKLAAYLVRKVRERGWTGDREPPIAALVERMAGLGYVDDRAFAAARAASLGRRGYGEHRVGAALRAAGIGDEDGAEARAQARERAWAAALRYAERRKLGPFAAAEGDRAAREKALAALLRAGHPAPLARRLAWAAPGEIPDTDSL
ncbi:MAG TPA: RecX family transcriptional regulator [Allosphingosinicella sp.]|nr:RecX family transcriptional regulator [Allosphingosinicella sp.]